MINLFHKALNRKAALKAAFLQKNQRRGLLFADDIYRYLSIHIRIQVDVDNVFTDDTPMISKVWRAFDLHLDNRNKRRYHLEPKEGGHRRLAIIQAELCSPVHPETASVSKPQLFRRKDFKNAGLEVGHCESYGYDHCCYTKYNCRRH
jgi:hypothetical protein